MTLLLALLACTDKTGTPGDSDPQAENLDRDGDGWLNDEDCAPDERDIYPGADEWCDGIDNDCDGTVDEDVTTTYYADGDADGYGDEASPIEACERPDGAAVIGNDCDDQDPDRFPGSPEVCNEIDDDCDDEVDEGKLITWWTDADADGYGDPEGALEACTQPDGTVTNDEDCDDTNANANPDETEVCDEADNDCDGTVDEGVTTTYWGDVDNDGYGDPDFDTEACSLPTGYAANDTDCDDSDGSIHPGATEGVNDGIDQDCDGGEWCYQDADGDSYGDDSGAVTDSSDMDCTDDGEADDTDDCDDAQASTYPGADEYCDSVDSDCDGSLDDGDEVDAYTWFADSDGDSYGDASVSTEDCDQPSGYVSDDTDCDDTDADVNPGASEACNATDDDCDGDIDEGVLGTGEDCPAEDCAEILADDPSATDGTYTLDLGDYDCDMTTDGGGWTLVQEDAAVYGTGYDTSYYNSEGFTWNEVLFAYASGSTHGHCTYPSAMTGCVPLGFQFVSESWGVAQNWGSSICGMSTTDYTSNTTFSGSTDFIIDRSDSTDTIRLGMLEGISSCTTSDNYGTAYVDIWVRQ